MTILRDTGGQTLFLEGRLEGVGVPDLIHAICLPHRTGTLTLTRGTVTKTLYISEGQLLFANSTSPDERLGETLLRSGVIGYKQLEEAIRLLGNGKRLGTILVELGYLAPTNLVRGLLHQVKEIILSLFPWESGSYRFVEGPLPTMEVITLNISTPKLICDGIHRIGAWPRIAHSVGGSHSMYRVTREGRLLAEELDLGPAERALLDVLEKPVTVGEICTSVFLPNFDVYQYLWAFRILGIIAPVIATRSSTLPVSGQFADREGSLAGTAFGPLLLRLCRGKETGILELRRDGEEKSVHVRGGAIVFATSSRSDESLTTFLLRRGVIGLRDKEEIERRLLSNKRAGTILREMGILSNDELSRFVRDQLEEIVLSLFSWDLGDWRFTAGDLPTFEEITLDLTAEELIFRGVRAVRDWSTVRAGCGDLCDSLQPVDGVIADLPAGALGPDEQEVLAALTTCRTVGKICETTQVSDFRAAQILWALQMLGAVSRFEPGTATIPVAATNPVAAASTMAAVNPTAAASTMAAATGASTGSPSIGDGAQIPAGAAAPGTAASTRVESTGKATAASTRIESTGRAASAAFLAGDAPAAGDVHETVKHTVEPHASQRIASGAPAAATPDQPRAIPIAGETQHTDYDPMADTIRMHVGPSGVSPVPTESGRIDRTAWEQQFAANSPYPDRRHDDAPLEGPDRRSGAAARDVAAELLANTGPMAARGGSDPGAETGAPESSMESAASADPFEAGTGPFSGPAYYKRAAATTDDDADGGSSTRARSGGDAEGASGSDNDGDSGFGRLAGSPRAGHGLGEGKALDEISGPFAAKSGLSGIDREFGAASGAGASGSDLDLTAPARETDARGRSVEPDMSLEEFASSIGGAGAPRKGYDAFGEPTDPAGGWQQTAADGPFARAENGDSTEYESPSATEVSGSRGEDCSFSAGEKAEASADQAPGTSSGPQSIPLSDVAPDGPAGPGETVSHSQSHGHSIGDSHAHSPKHAPAHAPALAMAGSSIAPPHSTTGASVGSGTESEATSDAHALVAAGASAASGVAGACAALALSAAGASAAPAITAVGASAAPGVSGASGEVAAVGVSDAAAISAIGASDALASSAVGTSAAPRVAGVSGGPGLSAVGISSASERAAGASGSDVSERAANERGDSSRGPAESDGSRVPQTPSRPGTALEAVGSGRLEEIERFNRRHRGIYAVLRGAVGAGAKNFVTTCIRRLDKTQPLFTDLPLDESGAFSASALFERVGALDPETIRRRLETLITAEVDFARAFLDETTVQKMFKKVEEVTEDVPVQA